MSSGPAFTPESLAFLAVLAANNSKDWFTANRKSYEEHIKAPAEQLKADLALTLTERCGQDMAAKIFRLNRDLRFSKDKTPYNTHVRMAFWPEGGAFKGKTAQPPSFFLSIEPDHLVIGAGIMAFSSTMLNAYRNALATGDGALLQDLLSGLGSAGFTLSEPDLKKPAPGFSADHPHTELSRHKGLAAWKTLPGTSLITQPGAANSLLDAWQPVFPLWTWLMEREQ